MILSQGQLNFFDTFGYLLIRQLFSPEETEKIIEGFEWSIQNWCGGKDPDRTTRIMFPGPIEHHPDMSAILDHPSILGLIGGVLGEDFYYCGGDGNYYVGDTGWHSDGWWGDLLAAKIAFYLDPLTQDTGALRFIPGTHRPDHFVRKEKIDVGNSLELFGIPSTEFPGNLALETNPGDVVIFNHDLYHASFGGEDRRRMFTMNCTINPKTTERQEQVWQYMRVHTPGSNNYVTGAGMYYPPMIDTADENRMTHLRQPIEIHDQLFPHLARDVVSQESVSDA